MALWSLTRVQEFRRSAAAHNGLKTIAAAITARPGHLAFLVSAPAPSAIVVARATDVALDSAAMLKQMTATFGGKGGGRPELAQGGGLQGDVNAMLAAARALIQSPQRSA